MAAHKTISECLAIVDTPEGRRRVHDSWKTGPYPHYEPVAEAPDLLIRIDEDGRRTVGRFVNRRFVAATEGTCRA